MNDIIKYISNPCSGYFALWMVYLMQGTLYASGSLLSQILLFAILLISLWHAFLMLTRKHAPIYFKGLNLLVLIFTIYGILLFFTDGWITQGITKQPLSLNYLKSYYISLLPIYSCYYYTLKGYLNEKIYKWWILIFFIVATAEYYRNEREIIEKMLNGDVENIVNNIGYIFLSLIPCMLLFRKNPLIGYSGIAYSMYFIIIGMKRGAIILAVIAVMLFVWFTMKRAKGVQKIGITLVVGVFLALFSFFITDRMTENDFFMSRVERTLEGYSSGRDEIYTTLWNNFLEDSNPITVFLGLGANGTLKIAKNYAHNDWLEIITNQGILGIILFFLYWYYFYRTLRYKKYDLDSRNALFMIFTLYFIKTMFSMSIGDMTIYVNSMLGYALADGFKRDKIKYRYEHYHKKNKSRVQISHT